MFDRGKLVWKLLTDAMGVGLFSLKFPGFSFVQHSVSIDEIFFYIENRLLFALESLSLTLIEKTYENLSNLNKLKEHSWQYESIVPKFWEQLLT